MCSIRRTIQGNLAKKFTNSLKDVIVTKIGIASGDNLWLFNGLSNAIVLYNCTTNAATTIGQPLSSKIILSQTNEATFYWIDEINNLYSSDIYGKIVLMCNFPAYDKIQIIDFERFLFSANNRLFLLNNTSKSIIEIEIVENSFKNFYYKDQNLAIFTDQEIKNFKITLP